ncbi:MAG: hypothetical protein ABIJ47_06885 [Candidatus Bathyarchaeota archaeon]
MRDLDMELVEVYREQLLRVAESRDLSALGKEDMAILREAGILVDYLDWRSGATYTGLSPWARRQVLGLPKARIMKWRAG